MAHDRNQEAQALIDQIPEGDEFNKIRHIVHATYENDPDTIDEFFDNRILGFVREIQTGTNPNRPEQEGRSVDEIAQEYWEVQLPALRGDSPRTGGGGGATEGGTTDADPGTLPGVLGGGQTIRVRAGGETRQYQIYEFPPGSGNFVSYQFNDRQQLVDTLGQDFDITSRSQAWFDENVLAEADAEEVIGQEGNFQELTDDIMREAAQEAGVRDPGLVGRMASDPEMQEVMAQAFIGEWSEKQVRAAQRQTNFWKNELYPGIENFYDSSAEPERAWKEYQRTVEPALSKLGYERGPDGTYKDQVARMLEQKIDSETFLQQVPTFVRATQNAEFATALNEWAERDLGKNIEFNDWFDLMAGEAQPELEDVAEKATLAWIAENQSANVSQQQIEQLAAKSQLSEREAVAAFTEFSRSVIATDGFKRSQLSEDDALRAMAGIDPKGDFNIEEARLEVAKLARENDLFDEEKISFFTGFDEQGRPQRPGLQQLTPEGA